MAATDLPPRFFKLFISHFSSDAMVIPVSYYDQLPRLLPKTAILQGPGGCFWKVAMKIKQEEVYFEQGWAKFVEDNTLSDGDFLTFVYNGDRNFEVSIYRRDGDKETRAVTEVEEDKEYSVCSLSSEEHTDTCSKSAMKNTIPKCRDKGKKKKEVVESSDEDSDSDSDYTEADDPFDFEENSNSDDSYAPDNENTTTCVKPKVTTLKKQGAAEKKKKVEPKIKNPERYLDNPKNVYFETNVKNRLYELLVHAQLVKDYCLRFGDHVDYIDGFGKLRAKTAKWKDQRVCIKRWMRICKRNALKIEDRILCEILRKGDFVYAIKLHIIRGKDL